MPRWLRYFSYLNLIGVLFVTGQMIKVWKSPLEYLAAYSLMGCYLSLTLIVIAIAVSVMIGLSEKMGLSVASRLFEGAVVGLLIVSWVNIVRNTLVAQGWQPQISTRTIFLLSFFTGLVARFIFNERVSAWLLGLSKRAILISAGTTVVWLSIVAAFFIRAPGGSIAEVQTSGIKLKARPNVIVIILDGLTSRDMSLYGYPLKTTPHLDNLADHWNVYDNAHSAGNGTAVNLPALVFGRYPVLFPFTRYGDLARDHSSWSNLLDLLRSDGYDTIYVQGGTIGPNFHHLHRDFNEILRAGSGWYLRGDLLSWTAKMNPKLWDFLFSPALPMAWVMPAPFAFSRTTIVEPMYGRTVEYLQRRQLQKTKKPFFLYMHMLRPHAPYFADNFQGTFLPLNAGFTTFASQIPLLNFPHSYTVADETSVQKMRLRYDENILKADQNVDEFFSSLKTLGLFDSSLIILMADHGTSFGGGVIGYYSPKLLSAEHSIPLMMKLPHQTEGRRISGLVSTVDILPTLADQLQLAPAGQLDGISLLNFDAAKQKNRVIFVCDATNPGNSYAALQGTLQLTQQSDGRESLFDMVNDPEHVHKLTVDQSDSGLELALQQFASRAKALNSFKR